MPIHLNDMDVADKVDGLNSALIVPCYLCPAVTVAEREKKPFIQLFSSFLKSPPFERYIMTLQAHLAEQGVTSAVFKSRFLLHWFVCMWSSRRRSKLKRHIEHYDSVIVLGCDSATETVRELLGADDGKVIQGMEVAGFMNARMTFHWPCNVSFEDCKVLPLPQQETEKQG